jgi:hypothetical protein
VLAISVWCSLVAYSQTLQPVSSIPEKIPLRLVDTARAGDFRLVADGRTATVYVSAEDFKVAQIAADCLGEDVERVTGMKPAVTHDAGNLSGPMVLIGTIGRSDVIDELIREGKLDTSSIVGQWESFVIATVTNALPGVDHALVIAGRDRRGTANGVFTLSEAIGVSPWVWWADVPPRKRDSIILGATAVTSHTPSVKYRGIFINDEDWGLQPWAAKTFEPETGDIGPKTYAKVFELLLRLKANYLWPAMHPSTRAFNHYPRNKIVADDYAIVMGSSHAEPMLRNNVDEWDRETMGEWDYGVNQEQILTYWEERVAENAPYESIYTIGMRGIHDSAMQGGGTMREKVERLEQVMADQRDLLAKYVNPDPSLVPQNFVPYKEVLTLYRNGLTVPDDATLVWPDDNHGYIRQLSTPEEQRRSGGAGVYYHISYWGAPEDYLWLCTTPPALIWEEMHKAFEHGARRLWVLNIGDIKPGEIGMEFFLRMAWDITPWNETAQPTFLADWARRNFGREHADEITAVLDEYYRLNFPAKPDHLHLAKFTSNYEEISRRLERFAKLVERTDAVRRSLPVEQRDAFYQLVAYPVRGSALLNRVHLDPSPEKAMAAYEQIQSETKHYNDQIAGGKWQHIMSSNPRNRPAMRKPDLNARTNRQSDSEAEPVNSDGGFISFEAEKPTRAVADGDASWKVIQGLGRSGDSIALLPTTTVIPETAVLEYDFTTAQTGGVSVVVYCLPTQPIHSGLKLRFGVSVDSGEAEIVDIATAEKSREWSANVLRAAAVETIGPFSVGPGEHTLKIRPLDPGLVFDKVVIDLGGLKPSHLGPPEM